MTCYNHVGKLSSKAKSDNQSLATWASDMIEDFYKSQKTSKKEVFYDNEEKYDKEKSPGHMPRTRKLYGRGTRLFS